jgi:hypothetical protein
VELHKDFIKCLINKGVRMKRFVVFSVCICSIILSTGLAAYNADFKVRKAFTSQLEAPPYTWMDTVNLSTGTYTPTSARICEIRTKKAGLLKLNLVDATGKKWPCGANDILRARITSIDSTGADTLKTGSITVYGFGEE